MDSIVEKTGLGDITPSEKHTFIKIKHWKVWGNILILHIYIFKRNLNAVLCVVVVLDFKK